MIIDKQFFNQAEHKRREKLHATYKTREYREAEFRVCRRWTSIDPTKLTEFDKCGECLECKRQVVYDAKTSREDRLICLLCAMSWAESGTQELADMSDVKIMDRYSDDELYKRLEKNIADNRAGAIAPRKKAPVQDPTPTGKALRRLGFDYKQPAAPLTPRI